MTSTRTSSYLSQCNPAVFSSAYASTKACALSAISPSAQNVTWAASVLPADGTWTAAQVTAALWANTTILVDPQSALGATAAACRANTCLSLGGAGGALAFAVNASFQAASNFSRVVRILLLNDVVLSAPAVLPPSNISFLLVVGAPNIDGSPRKLFLDSAAFASPSSATFGLQLGAFLGVQAASVLVVGLQVLPNNAATAAALPAASVPGGALQISRAFSAGGGAQLLAAVHDVFIDSALELSASAVQIACTNVGNSAAAAAGCPGSVGAAYNVRLLGGATSPSGAVAFSSIATVAAENITLQAACAAPCACRFASRALTVTAAGSTSVSSVAVSATSGCGVQGIALRATRPGALSVSGVAIAGASNYSGGVYVDVNALAAPVAQRYAHQEAAVSLTGISVSASQPSFGAAAVVVLGSAEVFAGAAGASGPLVTLAGVTLAGVACAGAAPFSTPNVTGAAAVTFPNSYGCGALIAAWAASPAAWPRVNVSALSAAGVGGAVDLGGALAVVNVPFVTVAGLNATGVRASWVAITPFIVCVGITFSNAAVAAPPAWGIAGLAIVLGHVLLRKTLLTLRTLSVPWEAAELGLRVADALGPALVALCVVCGALADAAAL